METSRINSAVAFVAACLGLFVAASPARADTTVASRTDERWQQGTCSLEGGTKLVYSHRTDSGAVARQRLPVPLPANEKVLHTRCDRHATHLVTTRSYYRLPGVRELMSAPAPADSAVQLRLPRSWGRPVAATTSWLRLFLVHSSGKLSYLAPSVDSRAWRACSLGRPMPPQTRVHVLRGIVFVARPGATSLMAVRPSLGPARSSPSTCSVIDFPLGARLERGFALQGHARSLFLVSRGVARRVAVEEHGGLDSVAVEDLETARCRRGAETTLRALAAGQTVALPDRSSPDRCSDTAAFLVLLGARHWVRAERPLARWIWRQAALADAARAAPLVVEFLRDRQQPAEAERYVTTMLADNDVSRWGFAKGLVRHCEDRQAYGECGRILVLASRFAKERDSEEAFLNNAGCYYWMVDDDRTAAQLFDRALRLSTAPKEAGFNLGYHQLVSGRKREAEAMLARVVAASPDWAPGWLGRALAFHARGERAAALEAYARAYQLDRRVTDLEDTVSGKPSERGLLRALRAIQLAHSRTLRPAARPRAERPLKTLVRRGAWLRVRAVPVVAFRSRR